MQANKLLYDEIKEQLLQRIASGELPVHAALPTVKELREQYQVSHITILHVFKDLRNMGVIEHYGRRHRVCRQLGLGRTASAEGSDLPVGLFLRPTIEHCYDCYFNDINLAVESELCLAHKYYLRSYASGVFNYQVQFGENEYPELLRELLALDGCSCGVLIDERVPDPVLAEFLRQKHRPAVLINRSTSLPISSIALSAAESVRLLWTRAVQLGYRFFISDDLPSSIYPNNRDLGVALGNIATSGEFPDLTLKIVDYGFREERHFFERLLKQYQKCTDCGKVLFWLPNNVMAYRFIAFMQNHDLQPARDFGVCGFYMSSENDGYPIQLSTVKVDTDFMGRHAVRTLLSMCAQPWLNNVQHLNCPQSFIFGETLKN